MATFVLATDGTHQYRCHGCAYRCQTWNHGETFCINAEWVGGTGFIFLKKGEYAPCGIRLKQIVADLDDPKSKLFPRTLITRDFGTFSMIQIEGDEAIYEGNELNTQGYQIRLANNGDFFGGLRNFAMFPDDDYAINFDEDGVAIEE